MLGEECGGEQKPGKERCVPVGFSVVRGKRARGVSGCRCEDIVVYICIF